MKRWLPRSLWLLAWSIWAWLGWGLYRELPRHLGPLTCSLPIGKEPRPLGFVGETNYVAVPSGSYGTDLTSLRIFDGQTAEYVAERKCPPSYDLAVETFQCIRHGAFLVRYRSEPNEPGFTRGIERVDLLTNERKRLTKQDFSFAALHPEQPWLLFLEEPLNGSQRLVVIDVTSSKELFAIEVAESCSIDAQPFFMSDGDRLALPITRKSSKPALEVWRIAMPPLMEASQPYAAGARTPSVSRNGRIVRQHPTDVDRYQVLDLHSGEVKFTTPGDAPKKMRRPGLLPRPPVISKDGKTLYDFETMTFWNIESGKALWSPASQESAIPTMKGSISVVENWTRWWRSTPSSMNDFITYAFRDYETGNVAMRVIGQRMPQFLNASGTLCADGFGNVYRWPPQVNWPLLALCQTILAMPLILLWAALRWRRKRRMRMASVAR